MSRTDRKPQTSDHAAFTLAVRKEARKAARYHLPNWGMTQAELEEMHEQMVDDFGPSFVNKLLGRTR